MEKIIKINTEYIKLNQLLKLSNIVSSGSEAKIITLQGLVSINNETVFEIRKKIYPGMSVLINYEGQISVIKVK